jgi:hypothetical protein
VEKIDLAGGESGIQEVTGRAVLLRCEAVFRMKKIDE